ncbi:hypothetical protein [Nocardioides plantarum]|uniref:ATP-grasp domain-containing protein n=1 Tax=Nocardioides plantarum TaxID=29299 RepID=A0ABV5KDX7_9ACTN|nr:hypothetical protein [Nocardioides plantarum]
MDLSDDATRGAVTARLGELYAGRPVILGPGILAGFTALVARLRTLGCPVLVLSTGTGAGPVPETGDCTVVEVALPPTASMTEEVRLLDRATRHLPPHVVAAIDAFDPERRARWRTTPFVTTDEPLLGRVVTGGRPAAWMALEDKLLADGVWDAAGVTRAPHRACPVDRASLAAASAELDAGQGVVWSGDARDGLNGGGNFVRWVLDERDRVAAYAFFAPRCDRVRVMPFLDGVPCSIHGIVLGPDAGGTAALRPVELAILRHLETRSFVYGGLSTWWDPPAADRDEMRAVARRVGDHLAATHGYRGAFGIDGVLTGDGFRPTELNTRASAGVSTLAQVDPGFFGLLQDHLVLGLDPGLTVEDVESLVPLLDARRTGRPSAVGQGVSLGGTHSYDLERREGRLARAPEGEATGTTLVAADTPVGFFARLDPCALLAPGDRLAPLNVALTTYLDQTYDSGFGPLGAAPDLR